MRFLSIAIGVLWLGTACASGERREPYEGRRYEAQQTQSFDAYTTDGSWVRVQQDRRTGELFITDPPGMSGERVVMINPSAASGSPLVEVRPDGDRRGDRDDRRREADHRDEHR
jgi:hypothetical protein